MNYECGNICGILSIPQSILVNMKNGTSGWLIFEYLGSAYQAIIRRLLFTRNTTCATNVLLYEGWYTRDPNS